MPRLFQVGIVLAAMGLSWSLTVFAPATASTETTAPLGSCVDLDNNGRCDAGEPLLVPLIGTSGSFDTGSSLPGYIPPSNRPIGIVLTDFPISGDLLLLASGTVTVNGHLGTREFARLTIKADTIDVGPEAPATIHLGRPDFDFSGTIEFDANTITIGPHSTVAVSGADNATFITAQTVNIGDGVRFINGKSFGLLQIDAAAAVTVGERVALSVGRYGSLSVSAGAGNINATDLHARGLTLGFSLSRPCGDQTPHQIVFSDSGLVVYPRGELDVGIGSFCGGTVAGDAIILMRTHVSLGQRATESFIPPPTIVP